jgi:hypothetical protein
MNTVRIRSIAVRAVRRAGPRIWRFAGRFEPMAAALAKCFASVAASGLVLLAVIGLLGSAVSGPASGEMWAYLTFPGVFSLVALANFGAWAALRRHRHAPVIQPLRDAPVQAGKQLAVVIGHVPYYLRGLYDRLRVQQR